ncbi:MAG: LytTR family DNA-binding domain-containing protein [Ferruginibacter sp.]|nr:response regulator transcription factor [Chitinophagaceae bacterium]
MKAIIIDDELSGREVLKKLVQLNCPDVTVIDTLNSIETGLRSIQEDKPDLVFLDIQMPNASGFDLLNQLEKIDFEIIFVTAHDSFAIRAFKYAAVDYLLKPIKVTELIDAVYRAAERIKNNQSQDHVKFMLEKVSPAKKIFVNNKILLPTLGGYNIIEVSEITYCKSESNYTRFHFTDGKNLVVSKTLKEFESILLENNFFRIHRSYIINLNCIAKYNKGKGGEVVMKDGAILEVSREKKEEFLKLFSISDS